MKYGDEVRITSGFYEGTEGTLFREYLIQDGWDGKTPINQRKTYNVISGGQILPQMFELSDLELIK